MADRLTEEQLSSKLSITYGRIRDTLPRFISPNMTIVEVYVVGSYLNSITITSCGETYIRTKITVNFNSGDDASIGIVRLVKQLRNIQGEYKFILKTEEAVNNGQEKTKNGDQ